MAQALQSGEAAAKLASTLGSSADAVAEVARLIMTSAAVVDATKRVRKSIAAIPRWVPWLVLIVFTLGVATGFALGRAKRGGGREVSTPPEAEVPAADVGP